MLIWDSTNYLITAESHLTFWHPEIILSHAMTKSATIPMPTNQIKPLRTAKKSFIY